MVGPAESVVLSGVCHYFMVAPAQTVLYSLVSVIVSWLLQLSVVLSSVCHCFIVAPAHCCILQCLPLFHGCSSSDRVVHSGVCHYFMVAPAQTVQYSLVSVIVSWLLQLRLCCILQCLPLFHGCSSSDSVVLSGVCHYFMVAPAQTVLYSLVSVMVAPAERVLYSPVSAIVS